jgi:predicted dienelactone hydrolase
MLPRARRHVIVPVAVAALLVAACGGDDGASDTTAGTDAPTTEAPATAAPTTDAPSTEPPATEPPATEAPATTVDPEQLAADANAYSERGELPVGVTTLLGPTGSLVEVWYPAVEGTTGTESYDMRDFVPESIRAILTADVDATFTYEAGRDAPVAEGTFPVVLFSHGFSGMRLQSTFLTAHLASHGMIVASPDHPSRDLNAVLSGTNDRDPASSVADLLGALDLLLAENTVPGGLFEGRIDGEHVAALGHSAGGGTVLRAAEDPRLDGYVSMASGAFTDDGTPLPDKASFFLAGSTDQVVPAEERTRPAYEAAPEPSWLWIIDGVGHNGFDDFCTFGNGTGIIGVAEASGLGALLDAQPQLRALGEDGCVPPSVPVEESFPIIRHAVTAALRWMVALDAEPVGLGPEVADSYELDVEIQQK